MSKAAIKQQPQEMTTKSRTSRNGNVRIVENVTEVKERKQRVGFTDIEPSV